MNLEDGRVVARSKATVWLKVDKGARAAASQRVPQIVCQGGQGGATSTGRSGKELRTKWEEEMGLRGRRERRWGDRR